MFFYVFFPNCYGLIAGVFVVVDGVRALFTDTRQSLMIFHRRRRRDAYFFFQTIRIKNKLH